VGGSLLFAYIIAGLVCLVLNYRRLEANDRRRIRVLVGGTVLSFAGWIPTGVLFGAFRASPTGAARFFYSPEYLAFTGVLFLVLPCSWAYAILRHRLFDIGVILRRGLQYALARRVLLTAVPALAGLLVLDLLLHANQPLLEILRARGWVYVVLGAAAAIAYVKRQSWLEDLDRRFFRERYDAQRLLREVVEQLRGSRSFEDVAPQVVARIDTALHPSFVALLLRQPQEPNYRCSTVVPSEHVLPVLAAESKLMALVRLLGKPLEVPQSAASWLQEQLPHEETECLRQARIELVVPIAAGKEQTEALLVLGPKRSEEPYAREDQDLLVAIANSLVLLLQQPSAASPARTDILEECPRCGACYDGGAGQCSTEGARLVPVVLPRLLDGRYRLERRLGRGGMGTVYLASDNALERRVAVKVIREDLVGNAEAAERFRREARAAASFAHPNVVTVHDFGIAAGARAFLVMELLEGGSLREELRRQRRLPPQRVAGILQGVCAALEAAHRRQLVHRDLKPENILLVAGESGEVAKLLDFGLAKFLTSVTMQPTADTAPGVVMGTLRYMSPEQRRGGEAHASWDLWALSVVTYEMLAGAYPFEGDLLDPDPARLATGFVPVKTHVPDAPGSWDQLFECCFARNPGRRPQSAIGFLSQLQDAL
jgi:tRNA A-37 threonylcarbamoyl transferase component Bud32